MARVTLASLMEVKAKSGQSPSLTVSDKAFRINLDYTDRVACV